MTEKNQLVYLLKLRVTVGLLGEIQPQAWWSSAFFSGTSSAFLSPMFSKTVFLARYHGVREAATLVHDEHIGIGKDVFHLFRLPERFERALHELMHDAAVLSFIADIVRDQTTAENFIQEFSQDSGTDNIGPVRIGPLSDLEKSSAWQLVAQQYLHAFQTDSKSFPYFKNEQ